MSAEQDPFDRSRACFAQLGGWLEGSEAAASSHAELEDELDRRGRELLRQSLAAVAALFGEQPIQIGAQLYLQDFYESFGFQQVGEGYLEDGIPHIHMVRS